MNVHIVVLAAQVEDIEIPQANSQLQAWLAVQQTASIVSAGDQSAAD